MKRRVLEVAVLGLAGLAGSSALAAAPSAYQRPTRTERVNVTSTGAQAHSPASTTAGTKCGLPDFGGDITPDGRYVGFASDADNLVPGDTNGSCDVFRLDRKTRKVTLVSAGVNGDPAQSLPNGYGSNEPALSADGRYVAFTSDAINIVPSDTNNAPDVFLRDMQLNRTVRVSLTSTGQQMEAKLGSGAGRPAISADGHTVVFQATSTNLAPGGQAGASDIIVRDLRTGRNRIASVSSSGARANAYAIWPSLSASGRYVVFASPATNLAPGALCLGADCPQMGVFWHDMQSGKTVQASVASDGSPPSFAAFPNCVVTGEPPVQLPYPATIVSGSVGICFINLPSTRRAISADGRYVTFDSNATNLVPNDANGLEGEDVFVRDVFANRTERVSVDPLGHERVEGSFSGALSPDGRTVSYTTNRVTCQNTDLPEPLAGLVGEGAGQCGSALELYTHDRLSGEDEWSSKAAGGAASKPGPCKDGLDTSYVRSFAAAMSTDGRYSLFASQTTNLVPGDTNGRCDWFVRDRGPALGVGGMTGTQPPSSAPPGCGLPVCPPVPAAAGLQQARLIRRQDLQDLFIRWDLTRMAPVSGAPAGGLLYELRFTSAGQQYAVRAQRIAGPDFDPAGGASFGLFRESLPGIWVHVASLQGGYGTIGDSVVTAVPLSLLGGKAQLSDVTAYTAVGSYLSGATTVLDSLRLSR